MQSPFRKFRFQRSWQGGGELTSRVYRSNTAQQWWRKTKFLAPLLGFLCCTWVVLLLYHPYFRLSHITLEGEYGDGGRYTHWLQDQITKRSVVSLAGNYFMYNTEQHTQELLTAFPLATASVKKEFPNRLIVSLTEKRNEISVRFQEVPYRFFTNGQVEKGISELPPDKTPLLMFVAPTLPETKKVREIAEMIIHFTTLIEAMPSLKRDAGGTWYYTLNLGTPYAIEVNTHRGWKAVFDIRQPLEVQLDEVVTILGIHNQESLVAIDVRVPGSAYIQKK